MYVQNINKQSNNIIKKVENERKRNGGQERERNSYFRVGAVQAYVHVHKEISNSYIFDSHESVST